MIFYYSCLLILGLFSSFIIPINSLKLTDKLILGRDVDEMRGLQQSYVDPPYWERYRNDFDKTIKRCKFLDNKIPLSGTQCPRMKTGDYTCLFGEQTCTDGSTHPTVTCDCMKPNRKFQCEPYRACKNIAVGESCPSEHPAYAQDKMTCSKEGMACNYGSQTCCGMTRHESTCSCVNGVFKCVNDYFCQKDCPVPYVGKRLKVANMTPFPGYSGPTSIRGRVAVRFNPDNTLAMKFSLWGLEKSCIDCGIHIHSGKSCSEAGGHYWDKSELGHKDIWWSESAVYNTDSDGKADSGFYTNSGYGFSQNTGHVVVVHDSKGDKAGCGVLEDDDDKSLHLLVAQMGNYPGFGSATVAIEGQVTVEVLDDNSLKYSFDVMGLPPKCEGCGAHIHSGKSCLTPADPKGHYWNTTWSSDDPWGIKNGATWTSDEFGYTAGSFFIYSGYGRENTDRVVVFHRADGVKVACGVLKTFWSAPSIPASPAKLVAAPNPTSQPTPIVPESSPQPTYATTRPLKPYTGKKLYVANMAKFPGYDGPTSASGGVSVRFHSDDSLMMKFVLYGLESNCTDCGIHIHAGISCQDAKGHFWDSSKVGEKDIWWSEKAVYNTNNIGFAESGFYTYSGYGFAQNSAHAVVIHDSQGNKVGCGELAEADDGSLSTLQAQIGNYPGFEGNTATPSGIVKVEIFDDNSLRYSYNVKGLPANCKNCGAHIHSGSSCDTPAGPGGHYWDIAWSAHDPWNAGNGATWTTDSSGTAVGSFFMYNGFGLENTDRAIVFHRDDGVKITCGILKDVQSTVNTTLPEQAWSDSFKFSVELILTMTDSNLNLCSDIILEQLETLIKNGITEHSSSYTRLEGSAFPFPLKVTGDISAKAGNDETSNVRRRLNSAFSYTGLVGCQYCNPNNFDARYNISDMEAYLSRELSIELSTLVAKVNDPCLGSGVEPESLVATFKFTNYTQPTPVDTATLTRAPIAFQAANTQTESGGTIAPTNRPTRRPTKFPTVTPVLATSISTNTGLVSALSCTKSVEVAEGLLMEYTLGSTTLKAKLTYEGIGWIGFGRSGGDMIGSEVVIGSSNTVQKYRLNGKAQSLVNPELPQTLQDTAFTQNTTHTVLEYTKILNEADELTISSGDNVFVWAYGWDNTLAYHRESGSRSISLETC